MSQSMFEAVRDFYRESGREFPTVPTHMGTDKRARMVVYMLEEALEFGQANSIVAQLDAITDLLYFVMDVFVELGIDPKIPFEIVHQTNRKKIVDGKIEFDYSVVPPRMKKPIGWEPPAAMFELLLQQIQAYNEHQAEMERILPKEMYEDVST